MLEGLNIITDPGLIGSKKAILAGVTLYVSPAVRRLIRGADDDELRHLLAHLPILDIPGHRPGRIAMRPFRSPLP